MSLPGFGSGLVSNFGTSIRGGSTFGASALTGSGLGGDSWSGAIEGASMPAASTAGAVAAGSTTLVGSPISWAACSAIGSLTVRILHSGLTFW
ncbi:hypothetical protein ABIF75_008160 [Bradyrhizobium japonicum]